MREDPAFNGLCPVADEAPAPLESNAQAIEIFQEAVQSSQQVDAEDKVYFYVRPEQLEALFRIHDAPQEDWPGLTRKVILLQDVYNDVRPRRPKSRPRR